MDEPIISPWIFYLAYLAKMSFVILLAAVAVIISIVAAHDYAKRNFETQEYSMRELDKQVQKYTHLSKSFPSNREYWLKAANLREDFWVTVDKFEEAADDFERIKAKTRQGIFLAIALIGLWVVIPSEATIYRMVVAQHVTPHNLQVTGETIEAVIDKTVDKIIKAKEDK